MSSTSSISLSSDRLNLSNGESINICDIIRIDMDDNESNSLLYLLYYPLIKNRRQRKEIQIPLPINQADHIYNKLKKEISSKPAPHLPSNGSRRILVLVNPFSGQQKAVDLWKNEAERVLSDAQWICTVIETERPGHATEIVMNLDIDEYSAILVNSGDGLISEVFQGLILRKDRDRALKMPIGHLPGGTSNALAAAICYACNEPFSARYGFMKEAAVMAARPSYRPLRLFQAEIAGIGKKPMFLSLAWGLIADIDIESERFRWAGMIRLHIEAVIRIAQLPTTCKYRARISYIPVHDSNMNRKTMFKHHVARKLFGKKHFNYDPIEQYSGEDVSSGHYSSMNEALSSSSFISQLPPLDQPITSSQFTVIEGDYVFACLVSISHLGSDLPFLPSAKLDDGDIFYLTLIDWRVIKHRLEVGILMATIDESRHLDYPCFQVIPVRACRIEPLGDCGGNVAIDGEPLGKGKAFQVEALPYTATVIGREEVIQSS